MICIKCKKVKRDKWYKSKRTGRFRKRNICNVCSRIKKVEKRTIQKQTQERLQKSLSRRKRRAPKVAYINKWKTENPCVDCGKYFPPVAMDFDHVRGKTKNISGMVHSGKYDLADVLEELKLCELVCANCHRIRTHKRKQK